MLVAAFDALPKAIHSACGSRRRSRRWRLGYRWGAGRSRNARHFWGGTLRAALNAPARSSLATSLRDSRARRRRPRSSAARRDVDQLERDFGRWQVPWGEVNRFQRISAAIEPPYSDASPSIPVPFGDGPLGSFASFRALRRRERSAGTATNGNSFVAVVEFGTRVRAQAVTAGGESGHPGSPHFDDEARRYASGDLRDVYFYPDQLQGHTERTYHPGE